MKYSINATMYPQTVKNIHFRNQTFDIVLEDKLASEFNDSFSIYSFRIEGIDSEMAREMESKLGLLTVAKLNTIRRGAYVEISTLNYRPLYQEESKYDSDFDDL